jgi:phosphoribosyl 1,2-cyclic phosphodiesterase/ActR/RegA family two-component response regulator
MHQKRRFLIIDDSQSILEVYTCLLEQAGHEVLALSSCDQAIKHVLTFKPDCILCDMILPGMDGLAFFKLMRQKKEIQHPFFVIISGKQYAYDQRHALDLGVDAYMTNPINPQTFVDDIIALIEGKMKIKFWGCRGTLTVPGEKSLKYGGNTNCIALTIANKQNFIFDAGTGIKELSNHIIKENILPYKAKIFISHPHYDHINGIPFFVPLYMKGNEFEFLGSDQGDVTLKEYLSEQMDSVYFPVTMNEFSSSVSFRSLTEETFMIEKIRIDTIMLNHPGRCLGYRVEYNGKIFCYITDNELYLKTDKARYNEEQVDRLVNFIKQADILIIDATYTDKEYKEKIGWGHSPISSVVDVADRAKVKLLCLHHHDPDQDDNDIDNKLVTATELLQEKNSSTICIVPHEGDEIII